MSTLRDGLTDYLAIRRQLGFTMPQDAKLLEGFVDYCEQARAQRLTTELALRWARLPQGVHPFTWSQRLTVVRGFARHMATIDPATQVPPVDLLPGNRPRIAPYIYTDEQIQALLAAAGQLHPSMRALRHQSLIGLLAVTGMRPGEALSLNRQDVDLGEGVVHVRAAKKKKQRQVPLHQSSISALGRYAGACREQWPTPATPAFFTSARGARMSREELNRTFTALIGQIGLEGHGARVRPRPTDLRHTFAVRTLLDWHAAEENIDQKMPLLSTYLGHVDPGSTYWYLEAVPELLKLVSARLGHLGKVLS